MCLASYCSFLMLNKQVLCLPNALVVQMASSVGFVPQNDYGSVSSDASTVWRRHREPSVLAILYIVEGPVGALVPGPRTPGPRGIEPSKVTEICAHSILVVVSFLG